MSEEDDDLFRRAMSDAKPLDVEDRVAKVRKKPPPKARFTKADEREALADSLEPDIDEQIASSGDSVRFKRPSVGRTTMRMLARGSYAIQAEIDLHGMTVAEAKPHLARFIERCAQNGKLCIRVVHGKGLGSGDRGPVLKNSVNRWLRRWDPVLAFATARQADGGTGAVYVLLKAN
ncbi:MAG: Smr/MutS family protein [Pseudomonadota bacterium]